MSLTQLRAHESTQEMAAQSKPDCSHWIVFKTFRNEFVVLKHVLRLRKICQKVCLPTHYTTRLHSLHNARVRMRAYVFHCVKTIISPKELMSYCILLIVIKFGLEIGIMS